MEILLRVITRAALDYFHWSNKLPTRVRSSEFRVRFVIQYSMWNCTGGLKGQKIHKDTVSGKDSSKICTNFMYEWVGSRYSLLTDMCHFSMRIPYSMFSLFLRFCAKHERIFIFIRKIELLVGRRSNHVAYWIFSRKSQRKNIFKIKFSFKFLYVSVKRNNKS